jgi:hypothetical protein
MRKKIDIITINKLEKLFFYPTSILLLLSGLTNYYAEQ